ncbi:MAG: hypothetical protein MUC75_05410 [Ignavibacteriaceae bacterium]|nr:hypothetical protein [Ignavibacteriaceae bacterium]
MKQILLLFIGIIFLATKPASAQDDCCGAGNIFSSILGSGIFGGYGFQQYSAEGLNGLIAANPILDENFDDFGFAHGWRAGANIIGIRQDDLLATFKFYYQSVKEIQEAGSGDETQELELQMNTWALGLGLSYIINNNLDIRLLDALMTFNSVNLNNDIHSVTSGDSKQEFESTESNIGFSFDAGLVYYPFPPYVAIEVLGGYSFFAVETMRDTEDFVDLETNGDFIDGGGFFAAAVLTIGIPFN